jgi:hypothetical protein
MALKIEKWDIPSLLLPQKQTEGDEDDPEVPTISYYKIGNIWIKVSTDYGFDGYSTVIESQHYERIDEPDLSGATLLKQKEVRDLGDSNREIAVYVCTSFARPSLMVYPDLIKDVMKSLQLSA